MTKPTGEIGIDEVGRGPLAGPVTVCACYVANKSKASKEYFNQTIRDSKKVKKDLREKIFQTIRKNSKLNNDIKFVVCSQKAEFIDRHGINKAIQKCIDNCLIKLDKELLKNGIEINDLNIKMDGGLKAKKTYKNQESFIKGDEKYVSIALASIIAKVKRDDYMLKLSRFFPDYAWDKNVGYGTEEHIKSIKKNGVTKYHRKTFINL